MERMANVYQPLWGINMKNKYITIGVLLTLIILTILGILTLNDNKKEVIYIKDLSFYTKRATIIRDEIDTIKDEACKNSLSDMFNRINETHFTANISIEEYYNAYYKDNKTFLNFYEEAVKSCELTSDLDDIYVLVLASSNYPNEIKKRYLLSHEFIIKDKNSREDLFKSADETGTYTTKALELQVMNELLSRVKS